MPLMRVRLELARTPDFPQGSASHGYEFIAPVDDSGHIDAGEWGQQKKECTVLRFWEGDEDREGFLRHTGTGWRFDYDEEDDQDDEPFFRLGKHALVPGAYVTVTESDGEQRPFRVVNVMPVLR
ncbi:MAG: hypothetical protein ACT4OG_04270 [Alphaproteobacteria bacterium]